MLAHVSTPEWILSGFILACAGWVLLAELLPGKRGPDDPPDSDTGDPEIAAVTA